MIVRYYENKELAYTSRKRYKTFNFVPFYEEEQRAVLLGDGASTTLKTNKEDNYGKRSNNSYRRADTGEHRGHVDAQGHQEGY